jgi:hypothetical protein
MFESVADDQTAFSASRGSLSQSKLGITAGFVVGGGIGLLANVAQVVELLNHRLATVMLVVAVAAVLGGMLLLARLLRSQPNGMTFVAIAGNVRARRVSRVESLRNGATVHQHESVTVAGERFSVGLTLRVFAQSHTGQRSHDVYLRGLVWG